MFLSSEGSRRCDQIQAIYPAPQAAKLWQRARIDDGQQCATAVIVFGSAMGRTRPSTVVRQRRACCIQEERRFETGLVARQAVVDFAHDGLGIDLAPDGGALRAESQRHQPGRLGLLVGVVA